MKTLEIPLTINANKAMAALHKLGEQGSESGDKIAKGAEHGEESIQSMFVEMLKVNVAMEAMSIGGKMLDAVSQGAIKASEDLKRMAMEFINLRDRARELAGVLGKPADIKFTKEQQQFAVETGFADPQKGIDFRTQFQGEANQFASRFKSSEEFARFEKEAARLGNRYGVSPNEMASLAGTTIRTGAMEGQTSEEAMRRLGASFATLMAGSGRISQLAGQLSQMSGMIGPGLSFKTIEEAAVATRAAAETKLPEAYTFQAEMRKGVLDLAVPKEKAKKKAELTGEQLAGARLGITPETTNLEAIQKLSEDQAAHPEKNLDVYLKELFPLERIQHAFRDMITAYRKEVVQKGIADAAKVKSGETEKGLVEFFADPLQPGMLDVEKAKTKQKEGELATDKTTIAPFIQRAHTALLELEESPAMQTYMALIDNRVMRWFRGANQQGYQGYEQLETAKAMGIIRQEARAAGIDPGQEPNIVTAPEAQVEHYLANLVNQTKEAIDVQKKQLAIAEQRKNLPLPIGMPNPQARN